VRRDVRVPDEGAAEERAWQVARAAFAEREPERPRRRVRPRLVLAAVAALAVAAAALSSPGRAVLGDLRERVGVERAQPALFSLPSGGSVLAVGPSVAWIVHADGSTRMLGPYRDVAWSPFGRFVVGATPLQLAALEPDGDKRWSLARPDVRLPAWGGTRVDTRIAYLTGSRLHVVSGDGTKDADAGGMPAAARVAPAWQPGPARVLAYVSTGGRVHVFAPGDGLRWRSSVLPDPLELAWSSDGARLLALGRRELRVYSAAGALLQRRLVRGAQDAAFAPGSHRVALLTGGPVAGGRLTVDGRPVFSGPGRFSGLAWSPDGRWLLLGWTSADQWLFVRTVGAPKVLAAGGIAAQFDGFPRIEGWVARAET
jgi:hypothetical protein